MSVTKKILTDAARAVFPNGSYKQWLEAGWTDEQMTEHKYLMDAAGVAAESAKIAASEAAQVAETKDDLRKLAESEEELYTANETLKATEKSGDEDATHECRKWVQHVEREIAIYRGRLGSLAPQPRSKAPSAAIGEYIPASLQPAMFEGFVYVNDIHRIVSPHGFLMDKPKFDAHPKFAGRLYQMTEDGREPSKSAWDSFVLGQIVQGAKVDGLVFKPSEQPGAIIELEGSRFVNTWRPVSIRMVPGDVTPFLKHLQILLPTDWRLLLNYLKFLMQHKGVKAKWWPFIQGVPGNGKSYISDTLEYCIGYKFTQRPTPKNLSSEFNASLYGCLFVALEDVMLTKDYESMWNVLKPMITNNRIEIQPKGVDKVTREVCFNAIINSNHKNGIRKTADDRRIAPFFSAQQRKGDLLRDGLTEGYFKTLWDWSDPEVGGQGWPHVAHFLTHEHIDADFDATQCPITSSTVEAIRVGRTPAEHEVGEAIESRLEGFKNGWVNMIRLDHVLSSHNLRHIQRQERLAIVESLGYIPHPGLPNGRLMLALNDGSTPVLYVSPDHPTMHLTDEAAIRHAYTTAQQS